jgi:O-antigen ligase
MDKGTRNLNKKEIWIDALRRWWILFFILAMILNLDQFFATLNIGLQPKYWSISIFITTILLFLSNFPHRRVISSPLVWWGFVYAIFSLVAMVGSDNQESAWTAMAMVITTNLYIITGVIAIPYLERHGNFLNYILWIALFLSTFSILYDYIYPGTFNPLIDANLTYDRASGLYLNPNIAGAAMLMIMICIVLRSSRWINIFVIFFSLIPIILTFSRSSIIGWAAVFLFLTTTRRLPRLSVIIFAFFASLIILLGAELMNLISDFISPSNRNALDRLAWILGQGNLEDSSASARGWIVSFAWNEFLSEPFKGHGLGYTSVWSVGLGTHNLILQHLVEYGVVGILIFPTFLFCSIYTKSSIIERRELFLLAIIMILISLFSHNLIEQGFFIFTWLICCLTSPSSNPRRPLLDARTFPGLRAKSRKL